MLARAAARLKWRARLKFGAETASREITSALIGKDDDKTSLLCSSADQATVKNIIQKRYGRRDQNTHPLPSSLSYSMLPEQTEPLHLIEPRGLDSNILAIPRLKRGRPHPVTLFHHTISYRNQLVDTFVPLALAPSYPCDTIVCSSRAAMTAIDRLLSQANKRVAPSAGFKGRLQLIPYCVDTSRFRPIAQSIARDTFRLPQDRFYFLVFGRISLADKCDLLPLLLVFKNLLETIGKSRRPPELIIAGKSRDRYSEHLRSVAKDIGISHSIRFISHISEGEKPLLYNAADVFVALSDNVQECFGMTLLEAMACGLPQIASNWSGYRDIVVPDHTGYLIRTIWAPCDEQIITDGGLEPNSFERDHFRLAQSVAIDPGELFSAMKASYNYPDKLADQGRNSRVRAVAEYGYTVFQNRFMLLSHETNEIADAITDVACDARDYQPAYYHVFGDFASSQLLDDSHIIANLGMRNAQQLLISPPYRDFYGGEAYRGWGLIDLFDFIANCPTGILWKDLKLNHKLSSNEQLLLRELLWLLKYGFVRLR